MDPPTHFCCPITLMIMEDPVTAPDGNSYEREALEQWARQKAPPRLPLTKIPFDVSQLVPNRALRDAIDDWKVQRGMPRSSVPKHTPTSSTTTTASNAPSYFAMTVGAVGIFALGLLLGYKSNNNKNAADSSDDDDEPCRSTVKSK